MSRHLFSTGAHTECESEAYDALTEAVSHHDADEAFEHIYFVMLFVASLWFIGVVFQRLGMPALVGEIIMGIIMGPNLLNLVGSHGSEFLIVMGEIGLIMLVVEAGLDVDIGMLKLIGARGLIIAVFGSFLPLSIGLAISLGFGESVQSSIAIGSCFAPTSMGIALNVLKGQRMLNTPTGQLIIAAAVLDDVIALIILSELGAMKHPTAKDVVLPLVVSPVLILLVGGLSIHVVPKVIKHIMAKIPAQHHEYGILCLLFASTFVLIPACHYVGSSHLLGAFLAGLMFCTDHTIHHVWTAQIKRVLQWMLRIFFACTIGFAIPVREFGSTTVIVRGLTYFSAVVGKLATGVFARPMNRKEFLTIGFSMSAWGEFAFIIATASYEEGTIDKTAFSAVLLAVLLSVIISPYLLRTTLLYFESHAQKKMDAHLQKYEGNADGHPVYFSINTKSRGSWGHQDKILHSIFTLELEIIDFRSWHAPEFNHSHHLPLTKESFYVMDQALILPPTKHLSDDDKRKLKERVKTVRSELKSVLGERSVVTIKRWLPGVLKTEDRIDKKDALFGEHVVPTRRPSYCRREAFKQAHSIMSSVDLGALARAAAPEYKKPMMQVMVMDGDDGVDKPDGDGGGGGVTPVQEADIAIAAAFDQTPPMSPMKAAKSVPAPDCAIPMPVPVGGAMSMLRRQNSDPIVIHSGAGHGGKTGGVGALPFTSPMINIYNDHHFLREQPNLAAAADEAEKQRKNLVGKLSRNNSDRADNAQPTAPLSRNNSDREFSTDNAQTGEESISYIYGDEDAEHHKLPEYQARTRTNSVASKIQLHQQMQQTTTPSGSDVGAFKFHSEMNVIHEHAEMEAHDEVANGQTNQNNDNNAANNTPTETASQLSTFPYQLDLNAIPERANDDDDDDDDAQKIQNATKDPESKNEEDDAP